MATIETEYDIGDEIWVCGRELEQVVKCNTCEGSGKLYSLSGKKTTCRDCWGKEQNERDITVPKKDKIARIQIIISSDSYIKKNNLRRFMNGKNISIEYVLESTFGSGDSMVFKTKEEVKKYIESEKSDDNQWRW